MLSFARTSRPSRSGGKLRGRVRRRDRRPPTPYKKAPALGRATRGPKHALRRYEKRAGSNSDGARIVPCRYPSARASRASRCARRCSGPSSKRRSSLATSTPLKPPGRRLPFADQIIFGDQCGSEAFVFGHAATTQAGVERPVISPSYVASRAAYSAGHRRRAVGLSAFELGM